nr:hypothetical protein [Saprospiraceae bacterium]
MILSACGLFEEDELYPHYIHMNDYHIVVEDQQGTADQNLSDSWVYYGGDLLGAFELGADVPILNNKENNQLLIFPGIRENGIRALPSLHFMLRPDTFDLQWEALKIDTLVPTFRYFDDVNFRLIENFEFGNTFNQNLDGNPSTRLVRSSEDSFEGSYSGKMEVFEGSEVLEAASDFIYLDLPNGRPVYLEMNYKNNHPFSVGLVGERPEAAETKFYKITFNESEDWNKVVINFQDEISLGGFTGYRILFGMSLDRDHPVDTATVFLDNLKLVHR